MAADSMVPERDVVLRERAAFEAAVKWVGTVRPHSRGSVAGELARRYPLPKRTRVIATHGYEYRVRPGTEHTDAPVIEGRNVPTNGYDGDAGPWGGVSTVPTYLVAHVADLLANPTEDVDA